MGVAEEKRRACNPATNKQHLARCTHTRVKTLARRTNPALEWPVDCQSWPCGCGCSWLHFYNFLNSLCSRMLRALFFTHGSLSVHPKHDKMKVVNMIHLSAGCLHQMTRCWLEYKTLASFRSSGQISSRSLSPFQTLRTLSVKVLTIRYHPCTWFWRISYKKPKQDIFIIVSFSLVKRFLTLERIVAQESPSGATTPHPTPARWASSSSSSSLLCLPALLVRRMRCHDQSLQQWAVVQRAMRPTTPWWVLNHKTGSFYWQIALTQL